MSVSVLVRGLTVSVCVSVSVLVCVCLCVPTVLSHCYFCFMQKHSSCDKSGVQQSTKVFLEVF